ncbi:MBL fold metallo-hydrolase [Alkalicoccus chagannorensis]|uniref:MBL fold metallo-hydrolase n=1 Tax=Alkalicoccus chagannorensis TaxID=427072 RepID=UPI00042776C6|nr:MBL fold metallo-hydrolase [Alkalicoccus chagannorensis]
MKMTCIGWWGAYPEAGGATSAYLLEHEGYRMLIDCGSGAVSHLQQHVNLAGLDAVLLSHRHHDHTADLGVLTYSRVVDMALEHTAAPLTIAAPVSDRDFFASYHREGSTEMMYYDVQDTLHLGNLVFTFQATKHPAPCAAVKVSDGKNTFVYTADTSYEDKLATFAADADLVIAEASFYAGQDAASFGHMTAEEAGIVAEKAQAKELWLTHLPHFGRHAQLEEEASAVYTGVVKLAAEGRQRSWHEK